MRCDGLVAATPAGSTGYNLANQGPILAWGVEGYVVSFIAPHTLTARPLVVAPGDVLSVTNAAGRDSVDIAVDGEHVGELASGASMEIELPGRHRPARPAARGELLPPHPREVRPPRSLSRLGRGPGGPTGPVGPRGANPSARAARTGGVLHELRIENLLLIERAELRLGRGPERDHRRDRRRQDRARALARPADGRQGAAADRPARGRGGLGRGRVRRCRRASSTTPSSPRSASGSPTVSRRSCSAGASAVSGRTSAFVAGRSASAADLRALGSRLLAFYGQHEHRRLTLASAQLEILDGFAGPDQLAARERYRDAHSRGHRARGRARRAPRARGRPRARPRPDALRARRDRGRRARPCRGGRAGRRARPAAPRRGAARGALRALGAISGEDAEGGASAALAVAEGGLAGVAGVDSALDDLAERLGALALELVRRRRRAARLPRDDRGRARPPRALEERLERARPAEAKARRHDRAGARARRALPRADRPARGRR